ncbi:MAG TPA: TMEM175 family protein [Nitrososphaeraceae archaeon]|jgi:uncharacterized membrane protein|nr:TMEM175 family protein [Nitrososphaeraceae archaeon]
MRRQIRLEHIISFGDAIFAFSITFMAISIQIPDLPANLSEAQVIDRLLGLSSHFEIYVISFFVIGIYWISYHQIFNHISDSRGIMVWLNLSFLFFITLISFAVDLQVEYGFYYIVFALYALVLALAGLLLMLIWLHARKNGLIDKTVKTIEIQNISLQSILTPAVFMISILISIVNIQIAYYFWLIIIPAKIIIHKRYS